MKIKIHLILCFYLRLVVNAILYTLFATLMTVGVMCKF